MNRIALWSSLGCVALVGALVSNSRLYDRRKTPPEDSPTFRVRY
jgi:hypothetical protein